MSIEDIYSGMINEGMDGRNEFGDISIDGQTGFSIIRADDGENYVFADSRGSAITSPDDIDEILAKVISLHEDGRAGIYDMAHGNEAQDLVGNESIYVNDLLQILAQASQPYIEIGISMREFTNIFR